jgi:hypothetical protein
VSLATLQAAAIVRTRQAIESLMTSSATILRNTPTQTATGGWRPNFVAAGTTKCLLTASVLGGGSEQSSAGQEAGLMSYTATVPSGTDIRPSDRLVVDATTFEVQSIKRADSWSTSDSAILIEVQRG